MSAAGPSGAKPTVLIVEDAPQIVELLAALVQPLNADVVSAATGAEALAVLDRLRPALITLDLVMPGLDGIGVLDVLARRGLLDEVPVVVISGRADPRTTKLAYEAGAWDFVTKPFNVTVIEAKLRTYLRLARRIDEMRVRHEALVGAARKVAEDVATPLGRIAAQAKHLGGAEVDGEQRSQAAREIEGDAAHVQALVSDLVRPI